MRTWPHHIRPSQTSARPEHTRQPKQPKQQEQLYICPWRKLKPANQLHLRTTIDKQALAHVICLLSSNHSSKNTLLCSIQTKYPSISSIFVFLAQSFGNSFAQYRQSYAFAAARPVLQATDASSKFQVSFQASKFDLLLVCARLVSKRSIRLVFVFVECSRRMRKGREDAIARQFVEGEGS